MIYYANPSTPKIRAQMDRGALGCILTPGQGNAPDYDRWDVIADNGCFANNWDAKNWWKWLLSRSRNMRFAVCPDVYDPSGAPCHVPTVRRWKKYAPRMRDEGFVPAFVCQKGATAYNVPDDAEVLFLGGSTEFKLGGQAEQIAIAAQYRGQWVHMGRVNSKKRMSLAHEWGVSSVDGTYLKWGPDVNLPKLLRWLGEIPTTESTLPDRG